MSASTPATSQLYHLVIFQTGDEEDYLGVLDRELVAEVGRLLDEKITTDRKNTKIDVWLHSPGGDAHAAYKLFLELKSRTRAYRVIIPHYAKSAATLLTLGASEILMAPAAELGPIDVQVEHSDREGKIVSALDAAGAISYLADLARELTVAAGPSVLKMTHLPRATVLHELLQFMARFFEPAMSKLDPQLVHHASNDLRVAHEYARRMLKARKSPKTGKKMSDESLSQFLVKNYPAHGFVISRGEARTLGLPIKKAENHPHWPFFKGVLQRDPDESIVRVLTDSELKPEGSKDDQSSAAHVEPPQEASGGDEGKKE